MINVILPFFDFRLDFLNCDKTIQIKYLKGCIQAIRIDLNLNIFEVSWKDCSFKYSEFIEDLFDFFVGFIHKLIIGCIVILELCPNGKWSIFIVLNRVSIKQWILLFRLSWFSEKCANVFFLVLHLFGFYMQLQFG